MSEIAVRQTRRPAHGLTGRMVLAIVIAFFGTVAAVNGVMIHYALSTFRGEVAAHPYEAGLAFNREIAASRAQNERNWTVEARLQNAPGGRALEVSMRDSAGAPISDLQVTATFAAPVDARLDRRVELTPIGEGRYSGAAPVLPGSWDLEIQSRRADEVLFQSKNRIRIE
ncbi:MAG TPA: FixH family protein [Roseiarcus sp.]|nr:FixH family protein [Roseiarcus sp.]